MLEGQNISCFAKDWTGDPTSNNHVMKLLARKNRVLWPVKDIPSAAREKLARKRIYFGHQSVGYNIVEGLQALLKEQPDIGIKKILETRSPEALDGPVFAHAKNGENEAPLTKIRDFADTLDKGLGAKTDIAMFKFCYIDFPPGTDVDKVFTEYKSTMARLRQSFPNTKFVHIIAPPSPWSSPDPRRW